MNTKIVSCTCDHPFQDEQYGKKKRLANKTTKDKNTPKYRCTICEKIH